VGVRYSSSATLFTKEQLDDFTITQTGPDDVKHHRARVLRNIARPNVDVLVDKLQMGWVIDRDKGTPSYVGGVGGTQCSVPRRRFEAIGVCCGNCLAAGA